MNVQLTKMWLGNLVTQEQVGAQTADDRSQSYSVRGEVRGYVGGRQRAIGRAGVSGSWKFRLVELTVLQVDLLKEWMADGVTVFARDHRGQSMYGTFFAVTATEAKSAGWQFAAYSVEVELLQVDVVEGV